MTTGDVAGEWPLVGRGDNLNTVNTPGSSEIDTDRMDRSGRVRRRIISLGLAGVAGVVLALGGPIAAAKIGNSGPSGGTAGPAEATPGASPTAEPLALDDRCEDQFERGFIDIEFGDRVEPAEYVNPNFNDRNGKKTLAAIEQKFEWALGLDPQDARDVMSTVLASDEKGEYPTTRDLMAAIIACTENSQRDPSLSYHVKMRWADRTGAVPYTGFDLENRYHHSYQGPVDIIIYQTGADGKTKIAKWYHARNMHIDLGATADRQENEDGTLRQVVYIYSLDPDNPGWLSEEV